MKHYCIDTAQDAVFLYYNTNIIYWGEHGRVSSSRAVGAATVTTILTGALFQCLIN